MKIQRGSEIILECLQRSGCEIVFGYPGGAIMPIYDSLKKYKKIKHILTGHEQGAVHMAEGYARVKHKTGICFATSGPGATNLVTGIADAMMDSVPLICITGQVASNMIGTEAFQEVAFTEIVKPITKKATLVTSTKDIKKIFIDSYNTAISGRPGPVVIDLPKDIQLEEVLVDFEDFSVNEIPKIKKLNLEKTYKLLNTSKKVLVLLGNGISISNTEKYLKKLLQKSNYLFASTLHGLSGDFDLSDNYLGMIGMHGNFAANQAINQADTILALGLRFDDRVTGNLNKFAKHAKIIHVDIDPKQLNRKVKVEIAINCDLQNFFQNFDLEKISSKPNWLTEKREVLTKEKLAIKKNVKGKFSMHSIMDDINDIIAKDKIVVADVGQHQMVVAREVKLKQNDIFFSSGGLGTMGFSLPAAIGAKLADPEKDVISISGDGGFQMNIQELVTIMRNQIPIKIFIFNNNYLGMVKQWQQKFYNNNFSQVNLQNPDFIGIAKSYKIEAYKVKNKIEAKQVLNKIKNIKKPVLVEFVCAKEENVFPMVIPGGGVDEMMFE